jgi:hypothetical protein
VSFAYTVFGLTLRCNTLILGLTPLESLPDSSEVSVLLGESPKAKNKDLDGVEELIYTSAYTDAKNNPNLQIWNSADGAFLHLVYSDGIEFWLERKGKAVWSVWPDRIALDDVVSYLLGPVFAILLRLRGVTCLHASAVAVGDSSLVFVGSEGAGKSTTAGAFARQGFGVISDDVAALAEDAGYFQVLPAYPHLCLWPDSVRMLYGSTEALPRLVPEWDKRRLALGKNGTRFESRPLRLGAVYLLGERRIDPAPSLEAVKPRDALLSLVANTFANKIPDREQRAREFEVLGRLVSNVPVRRVCPSNDPAQLDDLCEFIREDYASLRFLTSAESQ